MSENRIGTALKIAKTEGLFKLCAKFARHILIDSPLSALIRSLYGELLYEKLHVLIRARYWPQIKNPRTFNEKIINRKLYSDNDLFTIFADKYAVRGYVESEIGADILNEIYHVTTDPDTIPFDDLPDEFVIKATHGSGWNIIVDDKSDLDRDAVREQCQHWLSERYGQKLNEYWYDDIDPKIIVEKRLHGQDAPIPVDYKFWVFNGRVKYIDVDSDRLTEHKIRFFNREWEPQEFKFGYPLGESIDSPEQLDQMIEIAEELGEGLKFVRVDLYQPTPDKIIFGEMTLAPESGHGCFTPQSVDFELGSYW